MAVVDAAHGMKVAPDHVYVIQPNTHVAIADGVLSVTPRPDDRRPHYPVDHFLRSLAAVQAPSQSASSCRGPARMGRWGCVRSRRPGA
jgi:two-component system CheB/CheR fusion protein